MVRIGRCVVIVQMASDTIRREKIVIIAVMACSTGLGQMGSSKNIIIIMDGEGSRSPARICRMTVTTCIRNIDGDVIGIVGCIVYTDMTC